jgi:hypothetical protein
VSRQERTCNQLKTGNKNLTTLLSEYQPENQFNADETGLFYRQMPGKRVVQKGEKCKDGKLSKEKVSVLFFCCSAIGEKLKHFIIGTAARPRVFREQRTETKHLPVDWSSNKRPWMTSAIFEEWLVALYVTIRTSFVNLQRIIRSELSSGMYCRVK